jgi:hypothetical protein
VRQHRKDRESEYFDDQGVTTAMWHVAQDELRRLSANDTPGAAKSMPRKSLHGSPA